MASSGIYDNAAVQSENQLDPNSSAAVNVQVLENNENAEFPKHMNQTRADEILHIIQDYFPDLPTAITSYTTESEVGMSNQAALNKLIIRLYTRIRQIVLRENCGIGVKSKKHRQHNNDSDSEHEETDTDNVNRSSKTQRTERNAPTCAYGYTRNVQALNAEIAYLKDLYTRDIVGIRSRIRKIRQDKQAAIDETVHLKADYVKKSKELDRFKKELLRNQDDIEELDTLIENEKNLRAEITRLKIHIKLLNKRLENKRTEETVLESRLNFATSGSDVNRSILNAALAPTDQGINTAELNASLARANKAKETAQRNLRELESKMIASERERQASIQRTEQLSRELNELKANISRGEQEQQLKQKVAQDDYAANQQLLQAIELEKRKLENARDNLNACVNERSTYLETYARFIENETLSFKQFIVDQRMALEQNSQNPTLQQGDRAQNINDFSLKEAALSERLEQFYNVKALLADQLKMGSDEAAADYIKEIQLLSQQVKEYELELSDKEKVINELNLETIRIPALEARASKNAETSLELADVLSKLRYTEESHNEEIQSLNAQINQYKNEIENLTFNLDTVNGGFEASLEQLDQKHAAADAMNRNQINELTEKLAVEVSTNQLLNEQMDRLQTMYDELKLSITDNVQRQNVAELNDVIQSLQSEKLQAQQGERAEKRKNEMMVKDYDIKIAEMEKREQKLTIERTEWSDKARNLRLQLDNLTDEKNALTYRIEELRRAQATDILVQQDKNVTDLENHLSEKDARIAELSDDLFKSDNQLAAANKKLETFDAYRMNLVAQNEKLNAAYEKNKTYIRKFLNLIVPRNGVSLVHQDVDSMALEIESYLEAVRKLQENTPFVKYARFKIADLKLKGENVDLLEIIVDDIERRLVEFKKVQDPLENDPMQILVDTLLTAMVKNKNVISRPPFKVKRMAPKPPSPKRSLYNDQTSPLQSRKLLRSPKEPIVEDTLITADTDALISSVNIKGTTLPYMSLVSCPPDSFNEPPSNFIVQSDQPVSVVAEKARLCSTAKRGRDEDESDSFDGDMNKDSGKRHAVDNDRSFVADIKNIDEQLRQIRRDEEAVASILQTDPLEAIVTMEKTPTSTPVSKRTRSRTASIASYDVGFEGEESTAKEKRPKITRGIPNITVQVGGVPPLPEEDSETESEDEL